MHPQVPANNRKINWELIYGALIFGFGWGLSGICPGPMMVLVGAGYPKGTAVPSTLPGKNYDCHVTLKSLRLMCILARPNLSRWSLIGGF
jgi:hypothetical protein